MATDLILPRLPDQQPHLYYPHLLHEAAQYQHLQQLQQIQELQEKQQHRYLQQRQKQEQRRQRQQEQEQQHPPPPLPPSPAWPPQSSQSSTEQVSPLSTSDSSSPSSPKSYHSRRQRPLYVPAVLRPTQYRKTNLSKGSEDQDGNDRRARTNSVLISLPGLSGLGLPRLGRRLSGDSAKGLVSGDLNLDLFSKPTALPMRTHWKPDHESAVCDEPSCMRHFSYWNRRHHCRRCGNIFCDMHSTFDVPLDQDANFNPKGTVSRACSQCYVDYETWRHRANSQCSTGSPIESPVIGSPLSSSSLIVVAHGSQTAPPSPIPANPTGAGPIRVHGHRVFSLSNSASEVATSVPRDWNWSTF